LAPRPQTPATNRGWIARPVPLLDSMLGSTVRRCSSCSARWPAPLTACLNVASLLLARDRRPRESPCAALGASRACFSRCSSRNCYSPCRHILGFGAMRSWLVLASVPVDIPRLTQASVNHGCSASRSRSSRHGDPLRAPAGARVVAHAASVSGRIGTATGVRAPVEPRAGRHEVALACAV
jgi:hypothetical protein